MRTIRISQYQFHLTDQFRVGHRLSEAEASALNALRAENIRNLLAHKVRKAQEAEDGVLLSEEALAELQRKAWALDQNYRFGIRRSVPRQGSLEREARSIARVLLAAAKAQRGDERISEEEISEMMRSPAVQAEARARLEEQAKIANAALESLL